MAGAKKKGLGKGLSALLGDAAHTVLDQNSYQNNNLSNQNKELKENLQEKSSNRKLVPIEHLSRNINQPRVYFDEESLADLTNSIKEKGILQPILVRQVSDLQYEIVAGERRWRAAQKAGIHELPVVIKDLSDSQVLEIGLIENIQRKDLTPVEEAKGYKNLMDGFSHTQEEISKLVGKSRSHIANLLRLLTLPETVQGFVNDGQLSMGHARALIGADDPLVLARKIIAEGLSVRQTEALTSQAKVKGRREPRPGGLSSSAGKVKDADTIALENDLSEAIGMKVLIDHKGEAGKLSIDYLTLEQLDDLCVRLGVGLS